MLADDDLRALGRAASEYCAMLLASDLKHAMPLITEEAAASFGVRHGFGNPTAARAVLALAMVIVDRKGPELVENFAQIHEFAGKPPAGGLQ